MAFFGLETVRRRFLGAVAGALLVGLAACGGGGDGGTGPTVAPTAPTLLIRSEVTGEVRADFRVQFFFSAPVTFPSGTLPFSLSGASVVSGSFGAISADTYQVTLRPDPNRQGLVDLRVPAGAYADASGRATNAVSYEFAQPFNTLAPFSKLSFGGPVDPLGLITGPGTMTLEFDAVLDAPLRADQIQLTAGSAAQFLKVSGAGQKDRYTFVFTPPPATSGGVTFEIGRGVVSSGGIPNERNWWTFGLATP